MYAAIGVPIISNRLPSYELLAEDYPGIVGFTDDPIVSSDVIGSSLSLLFDTKGTVKAGTQTIKTLSWYENIGHAARLLDVVRLYSTLESKGEVA